MKKNERYEMTVDDISSEGFGIGRAGGMAVFTEGALPGDVIETLIVGVKINYCYGKLLKIITPSPFRVEPKCALSGKCGGCSLQSFAYEAQLAHKKSVVENALKRIGGLGGFETGGVIGMDNPYFYRNKAQFPASVINGAPALGFYSKRSHRLVAVDECAAVHPVNTAVINTVNAFLREYGVSVYNETSRTGVMRHVIVRTAFATGEIMVCAVINGDRLPHSDEFARELAKIGGMTSVCANINKNLGNVILGKKTITLWGKDHITDYIGNVKFQISPASFFQINSVQARVLYETSLAFADPSPDSVAADVYCGIGAFSLFFAPKVKKVIGLESVSQAVRDAEINAAANGIKNVRFVEGLAEQTLQNVAREEKPDIVILDPPRKGCEAGLLKTITDAGPEKIIYASCDPATLARDLRFLTQNSYILKKAHPVDMFPQTNHVETVCLLVKA